MFCTAWEHVPTAVATRSTGVRYLIPQIVPLLSAKVAAYWHPIDGHIRLVGDRAECYQALRKLAVHKPEVATDASPAQFIRIKAAAPLGVLGSAWTSANKMLGGPNALTNSIVGGLATGALGYGGGALLEHVFPEEYVERGRLRKTLGMLGLGAGVMPGLWKGTANARNDGTSFTQGMLTQDTAPPLQKLSKLLADMPINSQFSQAAAAYSLNFEKLAYGGALDVPSVPVDAFNRAIWNDVRMGVPASQNPFGSKDSWGDNSQSLHTPTQIGAAASGLVSGIAAQHGTDILRPRDVIAGLASAGVGLATANVAGRTLSALAGLTPSAQSQLQQAGLWGGIMRHVIPPLFGYR
jgi:hypothetical protein